MNVLILSVSLWLFVTVVVLRLIAIGAGREDDCPRPRIAWLALMLLVAAPVYFRPHELLPAGQDPGVYVNSAAAFARHGSLSYTDPLLPDVAPSKRGQFLFGHWGYGLTKDSCLEVKDLDAARIGPRFPPFFPLLMAPCMRLGLPRLALIITPLFALLSALALFTIMPRLAGRAHAGLLAPLFYLATPLVIWHARAPRPELAAGFLILAGFALALHVWDAPPWRRSMDLALSATAMALAPFFHVTAFFACLGAAVVMAAWGASGRRDAAIYAGAAGAGAAAYVLQTWFVADQYQLRRFLAPLFAHPALASAAMLALVALPLLFMAAVPHVARPAAGLKRVCPFCRVGGPQHLRGLAALALVAVCVWLVLRTPPTTTRDFSGYAYHYIHPTDLRLAAVFLSRAIALLALAGLARMLLDSRDTIPRAAFLAWLLPAALLVGNMHDFFMTRYLLTGLAPLVAAGLASLVAMPALTSTTRRVTVIAVTAAVAAWPLRARLPMVRTTEYRGLTRTLTQIAEPIRREDGILLAEYTRLAAPLEHIFGVPMLSLDNETRSDYRRAMAAWEGVMAVHPERPAFFLTPFPPPVSERFTFIPVQTVSLDYNVLSAGRYALPAAARTASIQLALYRVTATPAPVKLPFVRQADAGNTGRVRFSNVRPAKWQASGVALPAGRATRIPFDTPMTLGPNDRLLLVLLSDADAVVQPLLEGPGLDVAATPLGPGWFAAMLRADAPHASSFIDLTAAADAVVVQAWHVADGSMRPVVLAPDANSTPPTGMFASRWTYSPCRMLVPRPADAAAVFLMLVAAPGDSGARLDASIEGLGGPACRTRLTAGEWIWIAAPFAPGDVDGEWRWLDIDTEVTEGSPRRGDPVDLGLRIGPVAVVPW